MSLFRIQQMYRKFGLKPNDEPDFLTILHMRIRLNFLLEELLETAEACGFSLGEVHSNEKDATQFQFAFGKVPTSKISLAKALDGLIDLEVVTHGTAYLMGFGAHVPSTIQSRYATIWSEASDRVFLANMKKIPVESKEESKRGYGLDLKKPEGWKAPEFDDLLGINQ